MKQHSDDVPYQRQENADSYPRFISMSKGKESSEAFRTLFFACLDRNFFFAGLHVHCFAPFAGPATPKTPVHFPAKKKWPRDETMAEHRKNRNRKTHENTKRMLQE